jgi:Flp pilus assembly protein TadD
MYNYEQALHLDSNDPHTHFGLGVIRSELGDNKGALAAFNQALRLDPNYARVYNGPRVCP